MPRLNCADQKQFKQMQVPMQILDLTQYQYLIFEKKKTT